MPGIDGIEVTRLLAGPEAAVPVRVVVVTTFDRDEYVYPALRHGASGFLLKRAGQQAMHRALTGSRLVTLHGSFRHTVFLAGNACIDDAVTSYLVDGVRPSTDTSCAVAG